MRIARRNWILGAVLLGLLGAQAALRPGSDMEREIGPLLPALEGAEVARIVIEGGTDGARETLRIERDEEGAWRLTDHVGYAARSRQVDGLIDRLRGLTTLDLLSEDSASHAEYGVGEMGTDVSLLDAGGATLATLVQGEATGGRASYVRRAQDAGVYRAPHLPQITTAARQWIETALFRFRPELVDTIRLSGPDFGEGVFLKRDEGRIQSWTADGERNVAIAGVNTFLSRAGALFIDDIEGAFDADRFGAERLSVTIVERGGRELTARIGADEDGGLTLADPGGSAWLVAIPSAGANLLLEAARALR